MTDQILFLQAVTSNGLHVLVSEPKSEPIHMSAPNSSSPEPYEYLVFSWKAFTHPSLIPPTNAMSHYEWTIMVDYQGKQPREQLLQWQYVKAEHSNGSTPEKVQVKLSL